jgi:hypothetical protein
MARYRTKPVIVEAFRFTGGSNTESAVPIWFVDAVLARAIFALSDCIIIKTPEGDRRADIGDWIIRGVIGEIYPCKADVFAATYEAIE